MSALDTLLSTADEEQLRLEYEQYVKSNACALDPEKWAQGKLQDLEKKKQVNREAISSQFRELLLGSGFKYTLSTIQAGKHYALLGDKHKGICPLCEDVFCPYSR